MIKLQDPLTLKSAFMFPLQNSLARKEILVGGLLLLLPFIGWLLNMGHRIAMVNKMQKGLNPWPAWGNWLSLLKHGFVTWLGMLYYYLPAFICFAVGYRYDSILVYSISVSLFIAATIAIPGYMTYYCKKYNPSEIYNPIKAFGRTMESGRNYWHSWAIALAALFVSFAGLLLFGIGFLFTSVWFWQVAGYSFANTFSKLNTIQEV